MIQGESSEQLRRQKLRLWGTASPLAMSAFISPPLSRSIDVQNVLKNKKTLKDVKT